MAFTTDSKGPSPVLSCDRVRPSSESPRGNFAATVCENRRICTDHFRLILRVANFPQSTPGQFIQLDCRESGARDITEVCTPREWDWSPGGARPHPADHDFLGALAYLRRPFSIADRRSLADGSAEIDIIHRVVGKGTTRLAELAPGQAVSLLGPLGVGFRVPDDLALACLVGGGVGIPPMLYLAAALAGRGKDAVAFVGATRHDLLPVTISGGQPDVSGLPMPCVEEFSRGGHPAVVTTDDGSLGMKGFVTAALRTFLEKRRAESGTLEGIVIYCCGPTAMMKATGKVAAEFSVPCQVSLEQPMACGMGTCQSCIIRHRPHTGGPESEWKYKLTCTDGPVFDTRDIVW